METIKINMRATGIFPKLNKNNSLDGYRRAHTQSGSDTEQIQIDEMVTMTQAEWDEFTNNLLDNRHWLADKGGSGSDYDTDLDWTALMNNEGELAKWRREAYRIAILVVNAETGASIYVDPQGHRYARYVGFPLGELDTTTPSLKEQHEAKAAPAVSAVPAATEEPVTAPSPSGNGILVENIKARDRKRHGTTYPGEVMHGHHCEIGRRGGWIRLFGIETNRCDGPAAYDITFRIGDTAEYDSYNLNYLGEIVSIGKKTVTIKGTRQKRLDLSTFSWRNRNFDLERLTAQNHATSMSI